MLLTAKAARNHIVVPSNSTHRPRPTNVRRPAMPLLRSQTVLILTLALIVAAAAAACAPTANGLPTANALPTASGAAPSAAAVDASGELPPGAVASGPSTDPA